MMLRIASPVVVLQSHLIASDTICTKKNESICARCILSVKFDISGKILQRFFDFQWNT